MAVLVFSWAYRAADGRRHDFTFLNQGTFFLKWGTFFLLFTKIKMAHIQGSMHNTNKHVPPIRLKPGEGEKDPKSEREQNFETHYRSVQG